MARSVWIAIIRAISSGLLTVSLKLTLFLNDQNAFIFTANSLSDCELNLDGQPYPTLPLVQVDVEDVCNLLCNLTTHKARGPDGIPPQFLRDMAFSITPILTIYFSSIS